MEIIQIFHSKKVCFVGEYYFGVLIKTLAPYTQAFSVIFILPELWISAAMTNERIPWNTQVWYIMYKLKVFSMFKRRESILIMMTISARSTTAMTLAHLKLGTASHASSR